MPRIKSPAELADIIRRLGSRRAEKRYVSVTPSGTCGLAYASDQVFQALTAEIERQGLSDQVVVRSTGCLGFCENSPIVIISPEEICYFKVKPSDVPEIVSKTLLANKII